MRNERPTARKKVRATIRKQNDARVNCKVTRNFFFGKKNITWLGALLFSDSQQMGKRRTNTRRRRLYEAKMRGKERLEMEEARLADPETLVGHARLPIADLERFYKERAQRRKVENTENIPSVSSPPVSTESIPSVSSPPVSTWWDRIVGIFS